jgi:formate dehydrogenase subunit gamma
MLGAAVATPAPQRGTETRFAPAVRRSSQPSLDSLGVLGDNQTVTSAADPTDTGAAGVSEASGEVIAAALAAHRDVPGALLPVLHAIQDQLGYLSADVVARVADGLNVSRAEVHGVVTFYSDFRTEPPGRHLLRICRAEACQAMGAEALIAHLQSRHHLSLGETREDRSVTAEAVYCLGNCALSPAIVLDERPYGRVTDARLDELLAGAAGEPR